MTTISSRVGLRHVCTIERDTAEAGYGSSDYGTGVYAPGWGDQPDPAWTEHLTDQPCLVWVDAGEETIDATTSVVTQQMRLLLPTGTDVTENDRVASVSYRGDTIIPGPIEIRAVLFRRDYLELVLIRLS